ncbi:MAG: hypothetical protein AAFW46_00330 [Pseudomonadota bacterium]
MYHRLENLSVKAGFVILALLAFAIANFWILISDRSDREVRLATELGSLGRVDEALTMSAKMAAASDDSYERRYRKLLVERDGIIQRLQRLANTDEMKSMVEAVDRAQQAMIAVELRSFALNARGERGVAYGLLNELERRRDLSSYHAALDEVGEKAREDTARDTHEAKIWLIAAGAMLLLLGGAMLLREFRLRAHMAREAVYQAGRRAHRRVMQTVMDAHNNFLNNMVYFRVKAEMSADFDEEDLRLIDKALDDARDKLHVIAEMEEAAARDLDARDLGGEIEVLSGVEEAAAKLSARSAEEGGADGQTGDDEGSADASTTDAPADAPADGAADGEKAADEAWEEESLTPTAAHKMSFSTTAKPRTPTPVISVRGAKRGGSGGASQPS